MASVQVTLTASKPQSVTLDAPTGRIVVTQVSGTAAAVYVTADGNAAVIPGAGEVSDQQRTIPAVLGASVVLQPPLNQNVSINNPNDPPGWNIPTVWLVSGGTPTMVVEW